MSSNSRARTSSSNFQSIIESALRDYTEKTGVDLARYDFAHQLESCDSPDEVLWLLRNKAKKFKEYREGNRKLINFLSPIVQVIHAFAGFLGEATSLTPASPGKAIFIGVDVLLVAAIGVSSSYDALVDLFESVGSFLKRLSVYTEMPFPDRMRDILVKIMVEVLSVLALATNQIKQGRFKKFAKKLFGESDIEAVLQRLDRLTQEEARMTVAQTLEVVYGLVNNVKLVMEDGKASTDGIRQALGVFLSACLTSC
ncbi:hypothetical protein F5148DRAFT_415059 [Russula earlei]|uniref:Uncharacterized protein n=1 Tax=Russula earlei TaxID=71964 RepID=A0ACC0U015_9AGAM|nr:hypothetical protein F5148DRAFT_415059 [Russula earlei]